MEGKDYPSIQERKDNGRVYRIRLAIRADPRNPRGDINDRFIFRAQFD